MPPKISAADATYFLGFDGGGSKTECVLADAEGHVLARASGGPSNPLRTDI
jgi:N-acetylglucosamine kinase-like BadF-type ATPase